MEHFIEVEQEGYEVGVMHVFDSLNKEYGYKLVDKDKLVTRKHNLEFLYDYPLAMSVRFSHTRKGGWRKIDIVKAIQKDYSRIYREENASREGVYGIWGHVIGDLMIEGFEIRGRTVYPLIGS